MVLSKPQLAHPVLEQLNSRFVALAVSGGSDSMALMRLAVDERNGLFRQVALVAFTVDHGLREGSALEAARVAQWCQAHDIHHEILRWHAGRPATGLQAAARRARYDLMTDRCASVGCGMLLTAHTADDQAETVAMRMARTDSAKSLAGIWPVVRWNGILVGRPLLHERREALRGYLRGIGQPWIDDPSNDNVDFERVRVRKAMAGRDVPLFAARAESALAEAMVHSAAAAEWLGEHMSVSRFGHMRIGGACLARLPVAVQCEALACILKMLGGKTPLRAQVRDLVALLRSGQGFRRTLGGGLVAARTADVIVCREAGRIPPEVAVPDGGTVLWDGRFSITVPPGTVIRPLGRKRAFATAGVPSYVVAALPEVSIAGNAPFLPHFQPQDGVSVSLGERFKL
jgi:tRNA(Ile)-lysidine synthase